MKTAVAQFAASTDVAANLATCIRLISSAAAQGADLVVLPEVAMYYDAAKQAPPATHGEPLDGDFVSGLKAEARRSRIAVVAGVYERADDERDFNTLVAIDARGELLGSYRKIHLYDAFGYRESERIKPGDIGRPLVFDVGGVTVGALTCYDLRFPEAFRWAVDAGADAIVLPAAWAVGPLKEDHWTTLLKARAIENTVFLAAAGQTGPASCGQSLVVDPMGVVIANAGEGADSVAVADLAAERIASVRAVNPSLQNRRFAVSASASAAREAEPATV